MLPRVPVDRNSAAPVCNATHPGQPQTGPAARRWPRFHDASAAGQLNGELHVDATCVTFVAVSLGRSDSFMRSPAA